MVRRVCIKKISVFLERLLAVIAEDTDQSNPQSYDFETTYMESHNFLESRGSLEEQYQVKKYTIEAASKLAERVNAEASKMVSLSSSHIKESSTRLADR